MIARPSTMPGNTIGSEATLSSSQRPGIFVFTTIQQITEVTSMISVALPTREQQAVPHRRAEVRIVEDGAIRIERQRCAAPPSTAPRRTLQRRPEQHQRTAAPRSARK